MSKYYDDLAKEVHKMSQTSLVGMLAEKNNPAKSHEILTADILGTRYMIHKGMTEDDFSRLKNEDGFVDWSSKDVYIREYRKESGISNWESYEKSTIRHEVIHAFLYECGLDCCANGTDAWAVNEEMVDWFAIMSPKIYRCFEQLGVLD